MPSDTIATQVATRAEAQRLEEHRAALVSLRAFAFALEAPDPVIVTDMRRAALVALHDRDWQEFDIEAAVAFAAASCALRAARVGA